MNGDIWSIGFFSFGLASLLVGLSAWRRRTFPETCWLASLALVSGFWALAVVFKQLHQESDYVAFWNLMACGLMLLAPLFWLLFSFRIGGVGEDWFLRLLPFFWLVPFLMSLFILTNHGHELYLHFGVPPAGTWSDGRILISRGLLFRINRVYSYISISAGSLFSAHRFLQFRPPSAGRTLVAAAVLPWAVNTVDLAGLSPGKEDLTSLAFVASAGIIFFVFCKTHILDRAPFARDLLFREMKDGVLILDSRGCLITMNPAAEKNLQIPVGALGKPGDFVLKGWPGLEGHCSRGSEAEPSLSTETNCGDRWFDVKISPIRGLMGHIRGKMLVFRDISARKSLENELLQYATMDPLTEVFNRRMGLAILEKQISLTERNGTGLTICYVDINDLKTVNDNYGHAEGDFLILTVANALREALRDSDFLCRLGGDEFLMILPNCNQTQGESVFARVDQKLQEAWRKSGKPYHFEVARGFGEYMPGSRINVEELLCLADEKMYLHKVSFKDQGA